MGMFAHKELISERKSAVDTDLEFHIALSDRSKIPRRSDFNLLFKTFNEQKYGTREMDSIFKHLKGKLFFISFSTLLIHLNYS